MSTFRRYSLSSKLKWVCNGETLKMLDTVSMRYLLQTIVIRYVNSESGECWMSEKVLALNTYMDIDTVKELIEGLVKKKILIPTETQKRKTTTYRLNMNLEIENERKSASL